MLRVSEYFQQSDTGRERRANEDSLLARAPLFVVADGMGGAQAGEIASQLAIETFEPGLPGSGPVEERLAQRVREANRRIHEMASADEQRAGMGTTITAAYVGDGGVAIAHVGDSRAYLWRNGRLRRLTRDHSLVGELVRRGKLTEAEAEEHPQRSIITRALGPEAEVAVDTGTQPARDGDVFLLCSDGLTTMLPESRLAEILAVEPDLSAAGRRLVDEANAAGGRDNITVVLFRVDDPEHPAADDEEELTSVVPAVAPAPPQHAGGDRQATAMLPAAPAAPAERPRKARVRRAAETRERRRRRLRVGWPVGVGVVVVITVIFLVAGWFATRAVYFVGTNDDGFVSVYRGVPYELPFDLELYEEAYTSGVSALQVPPARRERLLDHELRSEDDAIDLVRELELGALEPVRPDGAGRSP